MCKFSASVAAVSAVSTGNMNWNRRMVCALNEYVSGRCVENLNQIKLSVQTGKT